MLEKGDYFVKLSFRVKVVSKFRYPRLGDMLFEVVLRGISSLEKGSRNIPNESDIIKIKSIPTSKAFKFI